MNSIDYRHLPGGICARCQRGSALGLLWRAPLCSSCISDWYSERSLGPVEINKALGQSNDPERWTPEAGERYAAEAMRRTLEWIQRGAKT